MQSVNTESKGKLGIPHELLVHHTNGHKHTNVSLLTGKLDSASRPEPEREFLNVLHFSADAVQSSMSL